MLKKFSKITLIRLGVVALIGGAGLAVFLKHRNENGGY